MLSDYLAPCCRLKRPAHNDVKATFILNNKSKSNGADSDSFQEKQRCRLIHMLTFSIPRCIPEKAALT